MRRRRTVGQAFETLELRYVLDSTVVFNEVMYHSASNDPNQEWIELHNQMALDMDISNWQVTGGIEFQFPNNTTIPGGGYLVIAKSPDFLQDTFNVSAWGPFEGRLGNGGDTIQLLNRSQRVMDELDYNDGRDWPAAADGAGPSLVKIRSQSASSDPANWTYSARLNGTPGQANFVPFDPSPVRSTLLYGDETWQFNLSDNAQPANWTDIDFDDSTWQTGQGTFFAGDLGIPTDSLEIPPPIAIANPSFEANSNIGVGYGRITGWTVSGTTGLNPSRSGGTTFLDNGLPADQRQVAFIQSDGALSQVLGGFIPGQTYQLQLAYNARACCSGQPKLQVQFEGTDLLEPFAVDAVGDDAAFHQLSVEFTPAAESGSLQIANIGGAGDHSLLLDAVSISAVSPAAGVVQNPSFEASGAVTSTTDLPIAGWNIDNSLHPATVLADANAHGQHLLQFDGDAAVSQTVTGLTVGQAYDLSLWVRVSAGQPSGKFEIAINQQTVRTSSLTPSANDSWSLIRHRFTAEADTIELRLSQVANASWQLDRVAVTLNSDQLGSPLDNVPTTTYFRREFTFDGNPDRSTLFLSGTVDDGAIVYLNGHEVWRTNMPDGPVTHQTLASSATVGDQIFLPEVALPRDVLRTGQNVLAVELHQASANDTDLAFLTQLHVEELPTDPNGHFAPILINEIAAAGDEVKVELANGGSSSIDLAGHQLVVGDQRIDLAGTLPINGYVTVERPLTLDNNALVYVVESAASPEVPSVTDAVRVSRSAQARWPNVTGSFHNATQPSFGQANDITLNDAIVINEIHYHDQPTFEVGDLVEDHLLLPFHSTWNYSDNNVAPAANWTNLNFNDADWPEGNAILYAGQVNIDFSGDLPDGVGTSTIAIANASFEEGPIAEWPGYGSIESWSNGGSSGLNDVTGPFLNDGTVPDGERVAFLQGATNMTQSLTGFVPGKRYTLQYYENERGLTDTDARVFASMGTNSIVSEHDVVRTDRFVHVISQPFTAATATASLRIGNVRNVGDAAEDNTALLDNVRMTRAVPLVANGNAELFSLAEGAAVNSPAGAGWTFLGQTGISRRQSAIQGNTFAPEGNQLLYLQGSSAISQRISGFESGVTYSFSWSERLSDASTTANDLEIVLDAGLATEKIISAKRLVSDKTFRTRSSQLFMADKSSYSVTLRTQNPNGNANATVLLDDLYFNFISEPLTLGDELAVGAATNYFRQTFPFSGNPENTSLFMNLLADDGAVVYLNGQEVYRQNLADGPLSHGQNALQNDAASRFTGVVSLPAEALRQGDNVLAVALHQAVGSEDVAFGATLFATETTPGSAYQESDTQWLELLNRSDATVDLSGWALNEGIEFQFAPETQLAPGEFLVVAKHPVQLQQQFPAARIVGPFGGQLSNSGERLVLSDALGNPADEVHYYDGGRWPEAADGGGSSLELINPWADNRLPENWRSSDESGRSQWQTYAYRAIADEPDGLAAPNYFHELIIGLLDEGQVLIDDIRVIEDPDGQAIDRLQNGSFQADAIGTAPNTWRIIGTHSGLVIADPDDGANHVLQLTATGATEHMHNHAETTFADRARIAEGQSYEISFRARWVSGSPQLNSRLYFGKAAATTILTTPNLTGTPGQVNSVYVENAGPNLQNLRHSPAVPSPEDAVTVTVAADDLHDVADVTLHYSVQGRAFRQVAMERNRDGQFSAIIPAQSADSVVQFFVSAHDSLGATSMLPLAGEDARSLYRVASSAIPNRTVHSLRLIMTPADVNLLHTNSNVMSNGRLGATVIYNDEEVFYDVGVRLRASGYGRGGPLAGFNIEFDADHLFRGVHGSIAVDRGVVISNGNGGGIRGESGASPHELLIYQIANHAGGIAGMYDDVVYIDAPRSGNTGLALLKMARYSDVFLDSQFDNGSDGSLFKFELIYHATTTTNGNPESLKRSPNAVIGIDISDLGTNKEAYRFNYVLKNNRAKDDFSSIMRLGQAFSLGRSELAEVVEDVIDVDQWMRYFAMTSLVGTADTYNMGLSHNIDLYVRPEDGKVLAFPWDVDHGFYYGPTSSLTGRGGSNFTKIMQLPQYRRLLYKHLLDLVQTTYNTDYLTPWAEHYSQVTQKVSSSFFVNYIDQRSTFVQSELNRLAPQVEFAISTNNGQPLTVDANQLRLQGEGWIDVHQIRLANSGETLPVVWLDDKQWQIDLSLVEGVNAIALEALDYQGNVVGTDTISVTSTVATPLLQQFLRISELMYNPADPTVAELAVDSNWNNEDFEFIELVNTSGSQPLDLSGVRLVDGPSEPFVFAAGTTLLPGNYLVLTSNPSAFAARYGMQIPVAGQYAGNLRNSGESIRLEDAQGNVVLQFEYSDQANWPTAADGDGYSLEIIDPANTAANEWSDAAKWQASAVLGGTPGRAATGLPGDLNGDGQQTAEDIDTFCRTNDLAFDFDGSGALDFGDLQILVQQYFQTSFGDANLDGIFNSSDFVSVFVAGQYEDAIADNSTWSTGDWNCDGEFSTQDLVVAFQFGSFVAAAETADSSASPVDAVFALRTSQVPHWQSTQKAAANQEQVGDGQILRVKRLDEQAIDSLFQA
ncbi:MAG: lamin tail domain-containing protein [Pirellulaceae bacterium]